MKFFESRDAPPNRLKYCDAGQECHLPEAAVMAAFALHLLEKGASDVKMHPDGEHGKRFDLKSLLEVNGFSLTKRLGTTAYGGIYQRGNETITVALIPGIGDVTGNVGGQKLVAECKGGIINTRHPGQTARLRRGLCEAVGLLMCQSGNYLRIWAGSRELNANRRALFANEKRGWVMIFQWLRPSMRLRTSPTTTFFGESNG
jgi:hypothetical protein